MRDIYNLKDIQLLTRQNQDLASRYEAAEKNAEANVKRRMSWKDETKSSSLNTLGPDIIKYIGISGVIVVIGRILEGMGPLIDIESGETGGTAFTLTFFMGVIVGAAIIMLINRTQRTR